MIFLVYCFVSIVYLIISNHATHSNKYTPLEQRVHYSYAARTSHYSVFWEFSVVIYGQGLHALEQEYFPLVLRHRWNVTSVFEWILRDRKQIDEILLENSLCDLANINCSVVPTDKAQCFAGSSRSSLASATKTPSHALESDVRCPADIFRWTNPLSWDRI